MYAVTLKRRILTRMLEQFASQHDGYCQRTEGHVVPPVLVISDMKNALPSLVLCQNK